MLLPYIAVPLYFVFGRRKLEGVHYGSSNTVAQEAGSTPHHVHPGERSITHALGLDEAVEFEELSIHQDGSQALKALVDCIQGSQRTLDICSFLVGRDALGQQIIELLISRSQQGVRVRLLVDGVGYYMGGFPSFKGLSAAGVQVAFFATPLMTTLNGRTNLRNHRKMAIADSWRLWSGGRNLAAEYFEGDIGISGKQHPWVDLSYDLYGPLAQQAQYRFDADWAFATRQGAKKVIRNHRLRLPSQDTGARLVPSGPDQVEDTIYTLIISGWFTAQSRVLIVTPYFVPDQILLMALTLAARRGVTVEILIPDRSNHRLADIARRAALRDLADAGARIWLFPEMLHAKAVIFDDVSALVGSANLDERSLFLNYELMVAFYEENAIAGFADWVIRHRNLATPYVRRVPGFVRELSEGMVRWVAFQL